MPPPPPQKNHDEGRVLVRLEERDDSGRVTDVFGRAARVAGATDADGDAEVLDVSAR